MTHNLGKHGQSFFSGLCDEEGLTVNQSLEEDKYGWDHFVEFPGEKSSTLPIDQMPSPIECKVQVKSTRKKEGKVQVKVSSLFRLVKTPIPAFFMFFEYGRANRPKKAYLVHVDEDIMSNTLEFVRKLEADEKGEKLHDHKITVKYESAHSIGTITGKNLKKAIQSHLKDGMDAYTQKKRSLLDNLGFPEYRHKVNFTFHSESGNLKNEITDMFLGKGNQVGVTRLETVTTRFGIDMPDKRLAAFGEGRISLEKIKPSLIGYVYFKKDDLSPPIEFQAGIFIPPFLLANEEDDNPFRIDAKYFEITSGSSVVNFRLKTNLNGNFKIAELRSLIWLFERVQSDNKMIMGFNFDGTAHNLGVIGNVSVESHSRTYTKIQNILDAAIYICNINKVSLERVVVSLDLLFQFGNNILFYHSALVGKFNATICWSEADDVTDQDLIDVAIVGALKSRIGNACFCVTYAAVFKNGKIFDKDDKLCSLVDEFRVSEAKFGSVQEIDNIEINVVKEPFIKALEKEGFAIHDRDEP